MKWYLFIFFTTIFSLTGIVNSATQAQACPMGQMVEPSACEQKETLSAFEDISVMQMYHHNLSIQDEETGNSCTTNQSCAQMAGSVCCSMSVFQPLVFVVSFVSDPMDSTIKEIQFLDSSSSLFSFHPEEPYRPPVFAA